MTSQSVKALTDKVYTIEDFDILDMPITFVGSIVLFRAHLKGTGKEGWKVFIKNPHNKDEFYEVIEYTG